MSANVGCNVGDEDVEAQVETKAEREAVSEEQQEERNKESTDEHAPQAEQHTGEARDGDAVAVQRLQVHKVQQWTVTEGWKARTDEIVPEAQTTPKISEQQQGKVAVRLQSNCSMHRQDTLSSVWGCSVTSSIAPTHDQLQDDGTSQTYKYVGDVFPMRLQTQHTSASNAEALCWDAWREGVENDQGRLEPVCARADAETRSTPEVLMSVVEPAGSSMAPGNADVQLSKGEAGESSAWQRVRRPKPGALVLKGAAAGASARSAASTGPGTMGSAPRAVGASSPGRPRSPRQIAAAGSASSRPVSPQSQRRSPQRSKQIEALESPSTGVGASASMSQLKPPPRQKARDSSVPTSQPDSRTKVGFDQPRRAIRQRMADRQKFARPLAVQDSVTKVLQSDEGVQAITPVTPPVMARPLAAGWPLAVAAGLSTAPVAMPSSFSSLSALPPTLRRPGVQALTLAAALPTEQRTSTPLSPHSSCAGAAGNDEQPHRVMSACGSSALSAARVMSSGGSAAQSAAHTTTPSSSRATADAPSVSSPLLVPAPPALPGSLLSLGVEVFPQLAAAAVEAQYEMGCSAEAGFATDRRGEGFNRQEGAAVRAARSAAPVSSALALAAPGSALVRPASPSGASSLRTASPMLVSPRWVSGATAGLAPGVSMGTARASTPAPLGALPTMSPPAAVTKSVPLEPQATETLAWMGDLQPQQALAVQSPLGSSALPSTGSTAGYMRIESDTSVSRGHLIHPFSFGSGHGSHITAPSVSVSHPSRTISPPPLGFSSRGASPSGLVTPQFPPAGVSTPKLGILPPSGISSAGMELYLNGGTSSVTSPLPPPGAIGLRGGAASPPLPADRARPIALHSAACGLASPLSPNGLQKSSTGRVPSPLGERCSAEPLGSESHSQAGRARSPAVARHPGAQPPNPGAASPAVPTASFGYRPDGMPVSRVPSLIASPAAKERKPSKQSL